MRRWSLLHFRLSQGHVAVLGCAKFVLLRKTQDSWEKISFNPECIHSGEVFFGKIA